MSQMNPKIFFNNITFSVQLPYIAGHSLEISKFLQEKLQNKKDSIVICDKHKKFNYNRELKANIYDI